MINSGLWEHVFRYLIDGLIKLNENNHYLQPGNCVHLTSSLVEEMASRMTPCTSLLPPRLPLLPTSPRHNRARTRADSGELGFFTWGEQGRSSKIRTEGDGHYECTNTDSPPVWGWTQFLVSLWGRRRTEQPHSEPQSGGTVCGWRCSLLRTESCETDLWETSATDWGGVESRGEERRKQEGEERRGEEETRKIGREGRGN